jgi:hypothetical protein
MPLDPRFTGSNPATDDGPLRVIKICSTASFEGEVNSLFPCCKFLRHAKETNRHEKIFGRQNSQPFLANFLLLRYLVCLQVIARQLWWLNQVHLEVRRRCTTNKKWSQRMGCLVQYHPMTATVTWSGTISPRFYWWEPSTMIHMTR